MSTEALRKQFEDACLANFIERRASGNIADDNGSPATHEALFWRKANGDYGVAMFNAAWWGYKAGQAHRDEIGEVLALNNEQAKTIRTLRNTIDEMAKASAEGVAAVRTLTHLGYTYHGSTHWKPPIGKQATPLNRYRVWPDGTVQDCADGNPYEWMSDDYQLIGAETPEQALEVSKRSVVAPKYVSQPTVRYTRVGRDTGDLGSLFNTPLSTLADSPSAVVEVPVQVVSEPTIASGNGGDFSGGGASSSWSDTSGSDSSSCSSGE